MPRVCTDRQCVSDAYQARKVYFEYAHKTYPEYIGVFPTDQRRGNETFTGLSQRFSRFLQPFGYSREILETKLFGTDIFGKSRRSYRIRRFGLGYPEG